MSRIVTFYSFKGGVGRSMALANVAVLLARRGLNVLAVDWDLEAPGLERYFDYFELSVSRGGLLPFLVEQRGRMAAGEPAHPERYRDHTWSIDVGGAHPLALLTSGRVSHADYARTLEHFGWDDFFERGGGDFLERLRDAWRADFDVVLIDSRTGMSDAGGICTILLPDVLVAMFTASFQSVLGARDVIDSARAARQRLAYDRMALTVLPVPSRFSAAGDPDAAGEWLDRFADELGDCLHDWLPRDAAPRAVLERIAIPHDDGVAFGERLAVVEHRQPGPRRLGVAYDRIAGLLAADFAEVDDVLGDAGRPRDDGKRVPRSPRTMTGSSSSSSSVRVSGIEYDVHVSYARVGSVVGEWAHRLVEAIAPRLSAALGRLARIYIDAEDPAGQVTQSYLDHLARGGALLAILTPQYLASSWCMTEWQSFEGREQQGGSPRIVPVVLRGMESLPARLRERAMIDASSSDLAASGEGTMEDLAEQVAAALAAVLAPRPAEVATDDALVGLEHPAASAPELGVPAAAKRVPAAPAQPSPVVPAPAVPTILFLPANPVTIAPVDLTTEARELSYQAGSSFVERFRVVFGHVADHARLERDLVDVRPRVVHFSGHGGNDGLYAEASDGLPRFITPAALARAFERAPTPVGLVVLSGCYSDEQGGALRYHVGAVVGTGPSTRHTATRAFCARLYRELAAGGSVGAAFNAARAAVSAVSHERPDAPRLLTRRGVDAGSLFLVGPRATR